MMRTPLSATFTLETPSDHEITLSREFQAPRELIFRACSSCEHVSRWWGPRHLRMVHCQIDFRVGGTYRFVQQAPDGSEFAFRGEYRELVPAERVVQTSEFEGAPGHVAVETMTLADLGSGLTRLTVVVRYPSAQARDAVIQSGMEAGARETYDRLEEYLVESLALAGVGQ